MTGLAGGVAMRSLCIDTLSIKASERSCCVATTLTFYFLLPPLIKYSTHTYT